ncbi:hypothetical protein EV192_12612 [Actinocrispum wychmicini]|uniref:Uncharacterized protein n=1 Tax=Actinocrispum wychmicini TaxID=1213861 RepID=A0A4R2IH50_9PSEU|nr:hypothetical protein EV192_12612 [Actinocrispum wychmicini]
MMRLGLQCVRAAALARIVLDTDAHAVAGDSTVKVC